MKDTRTTMPQMCTAGTLSQKLPEKGWTETIQHTSQKLATSKEKRSIANQTKY